MFTLTSQELALFVSLGVAHALSLVLALVTGLFMFWALAGLALVAVTSCALSITAVRYCQSAQELKRAALAPL